MPSTRSSTWSNVPCEMAFERLPLCVHGYMPTTGAKIACSATANQLYIRPKAFTLRTSFSIKFEMKAAPSVTTVKSPQEMCCLVQSVNRHCCIATFSNCPGTNTDPQMRTFRTQIPNTSLGLRKSTCCLTCPCFRRGQPLDCHRPLDCDRRSGQQRVKFLQHQLHRLFNGQGIHHDGRLGNRCRRKRQT